MVNLNDGGISERNGLKISRQKFLSFRFRNEKKREGIQIERFEGQFLNRGSVVQ